MQVGGCTSDRLRGAHLGKESLKSGKSCTPGHVSSVGVPSVRKILKISSISCFAPYYMPLFKPMQMHTRMQSVTELRRRNVEMQPALQADMCHDDPYSFVYVHPWAELMRGVNSAHVEARTESPGNRGRWLIISQKMQPMDQMSTGVE